MPQDDGSLVVYPHYNRSLGTANLKGYRFRDHRYDLLMEAGTFRVFRDDVLLATEHHGGSVTITKQGDVRRAVSGAGVEPGK
jgi:hypothetical protein